MEKKLIEAKEALDPVFAVDRKIKAVQQEIAKLTKQNREEQSPYIETMLLPEKKEKLETLKKEKEDLEK